MAGCARSGRPQPLSPPIPSQRTDRAPWTAPELLLVDLPAGRRLLLANVRLALPPIVTKAVNPSDAIDVRAGYRARQEQFRRLARLLETTVAREAAISVTLGGDFNAPA